MAIAFVPSGGVRCETIRFHHLGREMGLSQSSVQCIAQDSIGFLWFGTEDGLNRFDGYGFTVFRHDPSDSFSISDNYIWRLLEGRNGDLWIGTLRGGLNRYELSTGRFIAYRNDPADTTSLSSDNVTALYEDRSGSLWVGTWGGGLCRLDRGSKRFVRYRSDPHNQNSLNGNFISAVREDSAGYLWVGTWEGLARIDPTRTVFTRFVRRPDDPATLCNTMIWDLYIDAQNRVWIATRDGLDRYDPSTQGFQHYRHDASRSASLSSNNITCLLEDRGRRFWVGTYEGGVCLLDRESRTSTQFNESANPTLGPVRNDVLAMLEDRSGAVWFGTSGGISCIDPRADKFPLYGSMPGNPMGIINVRSLTESVRGGLWIGMNGGGVACLDIRRGVVTSLLHTPGNARGLSTDKVLCVREQRDGTLWIGTQGHGIDYLPPNSPQVLHFVNDPGNPRSLSDNTVIAIAEDRAGAMWVGTNGGGLCRFSAGSRECTRFRYSGLPGSLSGDWIWSLLVDRSGTLWVGTWTRGLNRYDAATNRFETFVNRPDDSSSLSNNSILCIFEDAKGILWLGTHGGGLNCFDPKTKTFRAYTQKNGLPNNVIHGILPDRRGNLWLSTNRGIARFTPSTGACRSYDVFDGLQSNEFDHGAFCGLSDGTMAFGGISGLNLFHPDSIRDNAFIPPVVVTGFNLAGGPAPLPQPVSASRSIHLTYDQNFFSFEFVALNYSSSAKNRYTYRLEGLEDEWVDAGNRRVAYYTNVPPGTYVFHVKGSNNDGIWNSAGRSITVIVDPPVWGTVWFRLLCAAAALLLVVFVYRRRVRGLERERQVEREFSTRLLESQESERKRIAGELHDSLVQNLLIVKNRALVGRQKSGDSAQALKEFTEITGVISSAIDEVRDLAHNLRPYQLDRLGLTRALTSLAGKMSDSTSIAFEAAVDNVDDCLAPESSIMVYRIVQEAVNNIVRHSGASRATISVRRLPAAVHILVQDDGRGMSGGAESTPGFGLSGIEQRVRMLKGTFAIEASRDHGTAVRVTFPVPR